MAPKPQGKQNPTARAAKKRAATLQPKATSMAPSKTQVNTPTRPTTRSVSARPEAKTSLEATQNTWTSPATTMPNDTQASQNVAGVIVTKPDLLHASIEGHYPSPFDDISRNQGQTERSTSKSSDRTLSSGITKSGKGKQSGGKTHSRGSAASTSNNTTPAGTSNTTTPAKSKFAAMLEQLREQGRQATTAIEQAESALTEAVTAEKEARAVVKKVEGLAQVARKEALATVEKAVQDKEEAIDTKKQAMEISKKFRDPRQKF